MPREVLYFAHAVNCYDTPYEQAALALIAHAFPGAAVENPNQPHHQEGYTRWKNATAENRDTHKAMSYFYDVVLPGCTGSVGMPFLDGRFGLGVSGELKQTLETGKPAWGIFPTRPPTPEDLAAWVANPTNGLFIVREFTDAERAELLATSKDGSALVVGHQETRLRTWFVYNKVARPYEEGHLARMPIPDGFYPEDKK